MKSQSLNYQKIFLLGVLNKHCKHLFSLMRAISSIIKIILYICMYMELESNYAVVLTLYNSLLEFVSVKLIL